MSKLLKLIEVVDKGKKYPNLGNLQDFCTINHEYINTTYAQEYIIKATFGANVVVTDPASLGYAVNQVKRSVNEAVFGEFRIPLREIQKLLWERKYEEASREVSKLENQMYSL